jgi:hypothetical protein
MNRDATTWPCEAASTILLLFRRSLSASFSSVFHLARFSASVLFVMRQFFSYLKHFMFREILAPYQKFILLQM